MKTTHPKVVWFDFSKPKDPCLGAILHSKQDFLAAILRNDLEAAMVNEARTSEGELPQDLGRRCRSSEERMTDYTRRVTCTNDAF